MSEVKIVVKVEEYLDDEYDANTDESCEDNTYTKVNEILTDQSEVKIEESDIKTEEDDYQMQSMEYMDVGYDSHIKYTLEESSDDESIGNVKKSVAQLRREKRQCCDLFAIEIVEKFKDNFSNVHQYLIKHKLVLSELDCPNCKNACTINLTKQIFTCNRQVEMINGKKAFCEHNQSIFKNTFFEGEIAIYKVLIYIQLFCLRAFSKKIIHKCLGIRGHSIAALAFKCRQVCISYMFNNCELLGGNDSIVEIYESKLGHKNCKLFRPSTDKWVFGGFDRSSRKFFLTSVKVRNLETFLNVIKRYIKQNTVIVNDSWEEYNLLKNETFLQYINSKNIKLVNPHSGEKTDNVRKLCTVISAWTPKFSKTKKHTAGHLARSFFVRSFANTPQTIHGFLVAASKLYNPKRTKK